MDHITRCPNCSTTFRVTEAQLAAFQGKVRCVKCAFVFNARQSLIEPPPAPAAPPPEMPAQAAETVEPAPSESLPFETAPQSHATVEDKPATADDFTVEAQEPPTEVPPETPAEAEAGAQTEVKEEGAEAAREESDPTALMQTEEPPLPRPERRRKMPKPAVTAPSSCPKTKRCSRRCRNRNMPESGPSPPCSQVLHSCCSLRSPTALT